MIPTLAELRLSNKILRAFPSSPHQLDLKAQLEAIQKERAREMQISEVIRQQLGGSQFEVMTGAHNFATSGRDLSFRIGRFPGVKSRYIRIEFDPIGDVYSMVFYDRSCSKVAHFDNVQAAELRSIFKQVTGLEVY